MMDESSEPRRLFRTEAVEAASSRLGSPVGTLGVASWVLTVFMIALAFAAAVFLLTARYARKESVTGSLTPIAGAQRLASLRPGIVGDVYAREGQMVAAGAPIMALTYDATLEGGQALGALLRQAGVAETTALSLQQSARAEAIESQIQEVIAKRAGIINRQAALRNDRILQEQRVDLAEQTVASTRSLFDRQLIAAIPMRQREEALLVARQQLGVLDRELQDQSSELVQIEAQHRRLRAERLDSAAQLAQAAARLNERSATLSGQQGQVLTARSAGRVAALQARPGSPVQPGQTLAVVLPEGASLEAELWVPSRAAGFLKAGDPVRLMFDAFPYQRFGIGRGRIKAVSRSPTLPSDLPTPIDTKEPLYRVLVKLEAQEVTAYGQTWALNPGMRLTADLILDDRPLLAWLFDPLLAIRARGADGASERRGSQVSEPSPS